MTPMKPELRQALKEAHTALTDALIDEYESLTVLRSQLTAERSADTIAAVDRKRDRILREHMPYFAQVSQIVDARRRAETPRMEPQVKIEIVRPEREPPKGS